MSSDLNNDLSKALNKDLKGTPASGLELYGRVCGSRGTCEECAIWEMRGDGMTCQEFLAKFPSRALSLLQDMDSKEFTYYNEYMTRFPNCNLSVNELAESTCRKLIFEGYTGCRGGDCVDCWLKEYKGDMTEVSFEEDDEQMT